MSSFGRLFRVTTFGESHSKGCNKVKAPKISKFGLVGVGCIVEGVPSKFKVTEEDIQKELDRRRPGQHALTTSRKETDKVTILSGCENSVSLGTPICLFIANEDQRPKDYEGLQTIPRPGHADYTYLVKYDINARSGGGRASARETAARVAAGAIARKYLYEKTNLQIVSWVSSIGDVEIPAKIQENYSMNVSEMMKPESS